MKKTNVKMNKPIYLGLTVLGTSKMLMYELWYDYFKLSYADNVKLCYMDTDSFIFHVKTEDFYEDIANDVEKDLIHQIIKSIDHCLQERIKNWPYIPDHPYRILIIGVQDLEKRMHY